MPDARSRPTPQQGGSQDLEQDHLSPFAMAWHQYVDAGWPGVIPIRTTYKDRPTDGKTPPPFGYTGKVHRGVYPTREQMQAWASRPGLFGNIALRAPDHVLGLDVDAYDGKPGAQTLADLEARFGDLPGTWKSTSRDDGYSGILWFRVPAGLQWPTKFPGLEVIQHGHRYGVVWPSVHPSGRLYVWWDPEDGDGDEPADRPPHIEELAELPTAWVAGLTDGKVQDHRPHQVQQHGGVVCDETMGVARRWLTAGEPCMVVVRFLEIFDQAVAAGHSRHDVMLQAQVRLLGLGEQGHRGVRAALDTLESMFVAAVGDSRTPALAEDEWQRALNGAPAEIRAKGLTPKDQRGCCPELATLDELAALHGLEVAQ